MWQGADPGVGPLTPTADRHRSMGARRAGLIKRLPCWSRSGLHRPSYQLPLLRLGRAGAGQAHRRAEGCGPSLNFSRGFQPDPSPRAVAGDSNPRCRRRGPTPAWLDGPGRSPQQPDRGRPVVGRWGSGHRLAGT